MTYGHDKCLMACGVFNKSTKCQPSTVKCFIMSKISKSEMGDTWVENLFRVTSACHKYRNSPNKCPQTYAKQR